MNFFCSHFQTIQAILKRVSESCLKLNCSYLVTFILTLLTTKKFLICLLMMHSLVLVPRSNFSDLQAILYPPQRILKICKWHKILNVQVAKQGKCLIN